MTRIADLIYEGNQPPGAFVTPGLSTVVDNDFWDEWRRMVYDVETAVKSSPLIVADNVARFLATGDHFLRDEAVLIPPYETVYIEAESNGLFPACDALACVAERTDKVSMPTSKLLTNPYKDFRWEVDLTFILRRGGRFGIIPIGFTYVLDSSGQLVLFPDGSFYTGFWFPSINRKIRSYLESSEGEMFQGLIYLLAKFTLFTLDFMNIKNVIEEVIQPSRQVRRSAARKGTQLPEYRTLVIDCNRSVKRYQNGTRRTGRTMPLHLAGGHFKTYTAEAPLMGKHVGTWYWEAQVRGSAEEGEIIKTYVVMPKNKKKVI